MLFLAAPVHFGGRGVRRVCVVPFGAGDHVLRSARRADAAAVADINVALLVVFAVASMGVYGIVLAGWTINSKYSLLGGLRISAQMISYELSYGVALATVIMLAGSLSLREIVDQQAGYWFGFIPKWYVFRSRWASSSYVIAGIAETNRAPFDFPEAEQELVAGYHTEYSSMASPCSSWPSTSTWSRCRPWRRTCSSAAGTGRSCRRVRVDLVPDQAAVLLFCYLWIRWTLPRFRYDQLMAFGWKVLLPVATVKLLATAAGVLYFGALISSSSTCSPASRCSASLLVIGAEEPDLQRPGAHRAFFGLSGLYVLLQAPFVAVVQIIVYAGAIMVLFLFMVMLLNVPREDAAEWDRRIRSTGRGRCASARCWPCCWSPSSAGR